MSNGANPVRDEHFVPRMYYRWFSQIKGRGKKEKAFIWQYNLKTMEQIPQQVNVDDICFERDLYELRDSEGHFISQNLIENAFTRIERSAGRVVRKISNVPDDVGRLGTELTLSDEEKNILIIFIVALKFRDPWTIRTGMEIIQELSPDFDLIKARNWTLLNILPLGIDNDWDKNTVVRTALQKYAGMAMQVGVSTDGEIFTSDNPIIEWRPGEFENHGRPRAVILPLTSRMAIYLYPVGIEYPSIIEAYFEMSDEQVKDIQINTAVCARERIFSKYQISDAQLERITEARRRIRER